MKEKLISKLNKEQLRKVAKGLGINKSEKMSAEILRARVSKESYSVIVKHLKNA